MAKTNKERISVITYVLYLFVELVNSERCSHSFQVWKPDENIIQRLRLLELEFANLTSFIEIGILRIRNEHLQEINCYQNKTSQLDIEISKLQSGLSKRSSNIIHCSEWNDTKKVIEKINKKIRLLEGKFKGMYRTSTRVKKSRTSEDSDITNEMVRDSVIDLRSEWIMLKRDIFDLHKEIAYLKRDHNDVTNTSRQFRKVIDTLSSSIQKFEHKLEHSSTKVRILNSNFDTLKQIVSGKDDMKLKEELAAIRTSIQIKETGLKSIAMTVKNLQNSVKELALGLRNNNNSEWKPHTGILTDCQDVSSRYIHPVSGIYAIKPNKSRSHENVYCEFSDHSYLVIQRRVEGLQRFDRNWLEYKFGFGSLYGDFWIGNEMIYLLTNQRPYILRIDMWDWEGKKGWAEYSVFRIDDHQQKYRLHVSGYNGTAGDSFKYHDDMKFSTEDSDNDINMHSCARENKSGWWFKSCFLSNLNGVYHKGWYTHAQSKNSDGIVWYTWKYSEYYSLKKVEMKIRRG